MITVISSKADEEVVREFFELFKTPWQFYREDSHSEVLLCSGSPLPETSAKLVFVYGAQVVENYDREQGVLHGNIRSSCVLRFLDEKIPIHGNYRAFQLAENCLLTEDVSRECIAFESKQPSQVIIRIGFDLFAEVRHLLESGQLADYASIPTLELHISFLRETMLNHSIAVVEIPPVPAGYTFIACLTHDVDHARVRYHKWDRAIVGFLFRALCASPIDFFRGRRRLTQVAASWKAVLALPFVYQGWAKDFWDQFAHYLEIERELASTFFFIPLKNHPGVDANDRQDAKRGARYGLDDVADDIKRLRAAGREIAVHGIDAWRDSKQGQAEREAIRRYTDSDELGVRMHWLFFAPNSAAALEAAGFSYDSTIGYNNAVGYRAGTTQVFKPWQTRHLLELPMHIMDTALFFPSHMHLSEEDARSVIAPLVFNASRYGGVLTINWHDRSLGPERLWDQSYVDLINYCAQAMRGSPPRPIRSRGLGSGAQPQSKRCSAKVKCSASKSPPPGRIIFRLCRSGSIIPRPESPTLAVGSPTPP